MELVLSIFLAVFISQAAAPAATGGITGRVTAEGSNTPIAGARILVFPSRPPQRPLRGNAAAYVPVGPPPQATTDQDGRFAFDKLAPGEYRLSVQKSGFAPLNEPTTPPPPVTVVAGQQVAVELHLQRGAVISGRVLDANAEPLTDAQVRAFRRVPAGRFFAGQGRLMPAPMTGPQQTNDLGEFRIAGLAPGEYAVAVAPHRFSPFRAAGASPRSSTGAAHTTMVTTFYPGTADQAAAQLISVAAGAEVGNIVFTVQSAPAYRVSGIVVDENGSPIADAMVSLMADPRGNGVMGVGPIGGARSDAKGRFAIDDVPAGTYRASASVIVRTAGRSGGGGIGAVSAGVFSFSSAAAALQPSDVVVTDADLSGVRIVAQRPNPQ